MKINEALSSKPVIYGVIVAGVIVVSLMNFAGWNFIRELEPQLLSQLQQQMKATGTTLALQLEETFTLYEMVEVLDDELEMTTLRAQMGDVRSAAEMARIFLVSPDQQWFISSDFAADSDIRLRSFLFDDSLFSVAALGRTPEPALNSLGKSYFLTGYTPVTGGAGDVAAILIMEAPAELFTTVNFFKQRSTLYSIGSLALTLLFASIIVLGVRRIFRIEQLLLEQGRLAQLGQMAAMVAHEIRNPLSIIKGSADVLRKKYGDRGDELFDFIPDEINRLNRLVSDFLQFAKRRELPLESADPEVLIEQMVQQIDDPRIRFTPGVTGHTLRLAPDAFKQVLLNTIDNALKAIDTEGEIRIETTLGGHLPRHYTITVSDDGEGMEAETLKNIFEPFFTTRATGSGLGMAITRQLVEQMNGRIVVESERSRGTRVMLSFPA